MNIFIQLYRRFRELILYGIIGGLCASLDFITYTILCLFLQYLVANIISVHIGIFCSFILNRQYNFKIKDKTFYRFKLFYLVGLTGLVVSEVLIYFFVDICGINHLVSKIITVFVSALLQFILNKYITFKKIK